MIVDGQVALAFSWPGAIMFVILLYRRKRILYSSHTFYFWKGLVVHDVHQLAYVLFMTFLLKPNFRSFSDRISSKFKYYDKNALDKSF